MNNLEDLATYKYKRVVERSKPYNYFKSPFSWFCICFYHAPLLNTYSRANMYMAQHHYQLLLCFLFLSKTGICLVLDDDPCKFHSVLYGPYSSSRSLGHRSFSQICRACKHWSGNCMSYLTVLFSDIFVVQWFTLFYTQSWGWSFTFKPAPSCL